MAKKTSSHKKQHQASGVPVFCKFDEIILPRNLKLYPGNYRKHPAEKLARAHKVIAGNGKKSNGWRRCIVVSKLSGYVTKGNGLAQMALQYNLDAPVEYQTYRNRAEELRDLIADNKLAEGAKDDKEALAKLLRELDASEVELAAVSSAEIEALLADTGEIEAEFPITAKLHESYDYVLVFTDNESDFAFLQTLCGVVPERSYKKTGVGLGRCLPFKRFLSALRENHHSIHVTRGHDDHSPARSRRDRVRPKKSVR